MNIAVSRHVFGSIRGYTTLAKSGDLSPEETAKLEMLSFGQTNESSYLGSLQTNPAYISRPLHSGRWTVTRVFQGKPDDHNRTTLLFISAVITIDDWLYSLKCDVNKLLYYPSLWQWNGEEKLEPIEIAIEDKREAPGPEIRNKVLTLLAAVEKYTRDENITIVVRTSDFDAKVLRWVNMVLPLSSKQTFSCATRSLNDGLPLALVSMAREGSFGNSRRRTVNWTLTSAIDNCPYAESLTQFWRPESRPPWQFIDSCKSFLIDLGGKPEPEPREPLVMRKPLYAEVAKSRIERKTYFSRKLAVILLICAVVGSLATVITIGAIRFKANKKVRSLIEAKIREAHSFVVENALNKFFTKDKHARAEIIKESRRLQNELEKDKDLLERAGDVQLKTPLNAGISELKEWYNLTQSENERHNLLEGLFTRVERFKLKARPYPTREKILRVDTLKKSIKANIEKAKYSAPNYKPRQNDFEEYVRSWRDKIKIFLLEKEDKVRKITQPFLLQTSPDNYSEKQYKEYKDFKRELEKFKEEEDESLTNAKDSPIEKHREIAKGAIAKLDRTLSDYNDVLKKLNDFKEKAEKSFNDANDILNKPNITDCTVDAVSNLVEAKSHLDEVRRLWPDKPDLEKKKEELSDKFRNNQRNILERWKNEIGEIQKETVADEPNVVKIDELLKEYEKVKAALQKANIQNIDGILQQIKKFDEKLRTQSSSISKPKEKESKQDK